MVGCLIAWIITAFFAVYGFVTLIHHCFDALLAQHDEPLYIVVPADTHSENIEIRLKESEMVLKKCANKKCKKVLVIDYGMDAFSRAVVMRAAADNENIMLIEGNELQKFC